MSKDSSACRFRNALRMLRHVAAKLLAEVSVIDENRSQIHLSMGLDRSLKPKYHAYKLDGYQAPSLRKL